MSQTKNTADFTPEYVIVELPNLLYNNYPSSMMQESHLSLLVCRANRLWSDADRAILKQVKQHAQDKIAFILNGVEIKEIEAVLGDIPKARSGMRKKIKNILRFQFYTTSHI